MNEFLIVALMSVLCVNMHSHKRPLPPHSNHMIDTTASSTATYAEDYFRFERTHCQMNHETFAGGGTLNTYFFHYEGVTLL
jgi:hypothetical protein